MLTAQPVYTVRCMGCCMVLVNDGYILVFTVFVCKWSSHLEELDERDLGGSPGI